MLLFLLRHADAIVEARNDAARVLSPKGGTQAKQIGKFCRWNNLIPELVLTSPLVRAEQTARLFAEAVDAPKLVTVAPFLESGMQPEIALKELKAYKNLKSVMLVGHEPDLGQLATKLLGATGAGKIKIRKASLTAFEFDPMRADSAVLQFCIPVKLM